MSHVFVFCSSWSSVGSQALWPASFILQGAARTVRSPRGTRRILSSATSTFFFSFFSAATDSGNEPHDLHTSFCHNRLIPKMPFRGSSTATSWNYLGRGRHQGAGSPFRMLQGFFLFFLHPSDHRTSNFQDGHSPPGPSTPHSGITRSNTLWYPWCRASERCKLEEAGVQFSRASMLPEQTMVKRTDVLGVDLLIGLPFSVHNSPFKHCKSWKDRQRKNELLWSKEQKKRIGNIFIKIYLVTNIWTIHKTYQ